MIIQPACAEDVPGILTLVNDHARLGQLLPRTANSIRDTLGDWLVAKDDAGEIVACVSLFPYSPVLAEVRSLAVKDGAKGMGWGSAILAEIIQKARCREFVTLFALTRAVHFFQRDGFRITERERFPEKVWRDCSICPLLEHCDEVAVVLNLTELGDTAELPSAPLDLKARPIPFHDTFHRDNL